MKEYGFGVDIGGTTCKMGLFQCDGTLLEKWEIPTDTTNKGENILKNIAATIEVKLNEKGISKDDVAGVGVGVPGPVSDGVVNGCVNLGWGVVDVEEEMTKLTDLKSRVGNDANVAALGESWMGSGKNYESIVMVTLGTGIGGGIVMDGHIIGGATGAAGEIGHIVVNEDEPESCNCGQHGCIEQYASATGIVKVARKYLSERSEKSSLRSVEDITAKDVFDAAKAGDELANEIVDDVCTRLAKVLCKISCVINPAAYVIGGGVSKAGDILIDTIANAFYDLAFTPCKNTDIVLAALGNDAGIYGAMKMIM